jgi:hypothetical protein
MEAVEEVEEVMEAAAEEAIHDDGCSRQGVKEIHRVMSNVAG